MPRATHPSCTCCSATPAAPGSSEPLPSPPQPPATPILQPDTIAQHGTSMHTLHTSGPGQPLPHSWSTGGGRGEGGALLVF